MNSGMRNRENYELWGKFGTYPGRSICWEEPFSPHLPSTDTGGISRRSRDKTPPAVHWRAQPMCGWPDRRTSPTVSRAAKGLKAQNHQNHGRWDMGRLDDLGKWQSMDDGPGGYRAERWMEQRAMENQKDFGGGWNSPGQLKRPQQPRRLLPSPPEQWPPQYVKDSPLVDQRLQLGYRPYKEQRASAHRPPRDASETRRLIPLNDQPGYTPPSNSPESNGSRPRPDKPPTYEMYLRMKRGKQAAEGPRSCQPGAGSKENYAWPWQAAAGSEREPGPGPACHRPALNAKAVSHATNARPHGACSEAACHGRSPRAVYQGERTAQIHPNSRRTEPRRSAEPQTRPGYGTCQALQRYINPEQTRSACPQAGRCANNSALRSGSTGVEVTDLAGGRQPRDGVKGEVLRSKRGEVVFCLISRQSTGRAAVDSTGEREPFGSAASPTRASKSPDRRQTPVGRGESGLHQGWCDSEALRSPNAQAHQPPCCADCTGFPTNQGSHSDGATYGEIYDDIENYRTRGGPDLPNAHQYYWPDSQAVPGGGEGQQPCYSDGEGVPGYTNLGVRERGFHLDIFDNSRPTLAARERGERQTVLRLKASQWGRVPVENNTRETASAPAARRLGKPADKGRELPGLEWHGQARSLALRRRALDAPLGSWGQKPNSNSSAQDGNNPRRNRERKLPEWKPPARSSATAGDWMGSERANGATGGDGVFLIDATCALVRAEYISSPKKERVRFLQPVEGGDFRSRVEAGANCEGETVGHDQRPGEAVRERDQSLRLDRERFYAGAEGDRGGRSAGIGSSPEKYPSPRPPGGEKESMKERASRILGFPVTGTNSAEVQAPGECGDTGDEPGKCGEVAQGDGRESVEALQSYSHWRDGLMDASHREGRAKRREIAEEAPLPPEGRDPDTETVGDAGGGGERLGRGERQERNLREVVFESVSRLRRHTAPDSESDGEEAEGPLVCEAPGAGDTGAESRGSSDSGVSADTVVACGVGQGVSEGGHGRLDPVPDAARGPRMDEPGDFTEVEWDNAERRGEDALEERPQGGDAPGPVPPDGAGRLECAVAAAEGKDPDAAAEGQGYHQELNEGPASPLSLPARLLP